MPRTFTCRDCGASFTVPQPALDKYPGWTPRQCNDCRPRKPADNPAIPPPLPDAMADAYGVEPVVELGERTRRSSSFTPRSSTAGGPQTGIFTDGGCDPNPGPGGWAAVKVRDGEIIEERAGHEDATTNNRMELRALIEAFDMLDRDEPATIFCDSQYAVRTINEWAPAWEVNGWRRGKQRGRVENLDLVQTLLAAARAHPNVKIEWLRGHAGSTWNQYADRLVRRNQHPELA
jgi:ribonuclease HI